MDNLLASPGEWDTHLTCGGRFPSAYAKWTLQTQWEYTLRCILLYYTNNMLTCF